MIESPSLPPTAQPSWRTIATTMRTCVRCEKAFDLKNLFMQTDLDEVLCKPCWRDAYENGEIDSDLEGQVLSWCLADFNMTVEGEGAPKKLRAPQEESSVSSESWKMQFSEEELGKYLFTEEKLYLGDWPVEVHGKVVLAIPRKSEDLASFGKVLVLMEAKLEDPMLPRVLTKAFKKECTVFSPKALFKGLVKDDDLGFFVGAAAWDGARQSTTQPIRINVATYFDNHKEGLTKAQVEYFTEVQREGLTIPVEVHCAPWAAHGDALTCAKGSMFGTGVNLMLTNKSKLAIVDVRSKAPDGLDPIPPNPPSSVLGEYHPLLNVMNWLPTVTLRILEKAEGCKDPLEVTELLNAAWRAQRNNQEKYPIQKIFMTNAAGSDEIVDMDASAGSGRPL